MKNGVALVTGGAGFIGSHTVDLLLDSGYKVRVVDNLSGGREDNLSGQKNNSNLTLETKDIRNLDPSSSIFTGVDYVFHFAGLGDIVPSIENPVDYMDVNVSGTLKVLEGARSSNNLKKFVYAASSSCYGLASTPTNENHRIDVLYPYALSKYMGEQSCFHWNKVYGLPVNSVRIFNAYGTRSRTSGTYGAVFGVFLKQKLAGAPLTVVGDGSQSRDFLYVSDVAQAFVLAAETVLTGEIWNLGAGAPQSINKLVELLGGEVVYLPKRPGEPEVTFADISKISRELLFKPRISFKDGVGKVLKEIHYWENAPLWDEETITRATKVWFEKLG